MQAPSAQAFADLIQKGRILTLPGYKPILRWEGAPGPLEHPVYDAAVESFTEVIMRGGWIDSDYQPSTVAKWLSDPAGIASGNLAKMRSMLTYFLRGERFADGHWAAMIENGQLAAILNRLEDLQTSS